MPTYEYPRPAVTVDLVVIASTGYGGRSLLTITRKNEPFKGMLALPGGFVDPFEEVIHAAKRELYEETGLDIKDGTGRIRLMDLYGRKGRDPRGWTISVAYALSWPPGRMDEIRAGDDASEVQWTNIIRNIPPMAFDHRDIVCAWLP
jgi:8-oxo-dGTP diphosphatase